jgi:hypothetical protein
MKNWAIIFLILLIAIEINCQNQMTEKIRKPCISDSVFRNYFQDSIAYNDFFTKSFLKQISKKCGASHLKTPENYDDSLYLPIFYMLLYAFEEEYINFNKPDNNAELYRFSVKPCFRKPYCIKLEKKNNKTYYTVKLTDGDGGYFTGTLTNSITKIYDDSLINCVSQRFIELNFWNLSEDTTCGRGFDGETWFIEALKNGRYNLIHRWVPYSCGDSTTHQLGNIGIELRQIGKTVIKDIEIRNYKLLPKKSFNH